MLYQRTCECTPVLYAMHEVYCQDVPDVGFYIVFRHVVHVVHLIEVQSDSNLFHTRTLHAITVT